MPGGALRRDPAAMAVAVKRLLSDDDLCRLLGAGARAFVERMMGYDDWRQK